MKLRQISIRRRLTLLMLFISGVVMLLMRGAFFGYEYYTFRQVTLQQLTTLGGVVAANSTAALAFDNQDDATEVLSALRAEKHLLAAALYDRDGRPFAHYPETLSTDAIPAAPGVDGFRFSGAYLAGFQPVVQGSRRLGTLYLEFDTGVVLREWIWGSLKIALAVMAVVLFVAYLLSRMLQRQISQPVIDLAETARGVSVRRDYSVRATKRSDDELGELTDAFNHMLGEIQTLHRGLEQRVAERTAQLETANADLNRSRTDLKSLFESIDEGYCIFEMIFDERNRPVDYRFLTINPAFEKHTGLTNAQGRLISELAPGQEAHWFETFGRVALTGEPARFQNYARPLNRWFDVYAFRYGDPAGRQVATLFTNITERKEQDKQIKQLNADLQQRATQLEGANKELESFSYSVSHDLRAPLRHIDGFAQLLQKRVGSTLDPVAQRHLETISSSARNLGTLIDELLLFCRMGRTEMRQMRVDVAEMINDVIRSLQPDLQGREIDWRIGEMPFVQADPAMLRQVWVNLLSNAVKYSRHRQPAVIAVSYRSDPVEGHVFSVRDNGAGFDMQYADKLFGVFQRLHSPREFEGTGIGLANVHRIILRHGGRVWAEGAVEVGATFHFALPALATAPAAPASTATSTT